MYYNKIIGSSGEDAAYQFLISKGYSIINKNFSCKFGEVDIIALDESHSDIELVFVEVKTRSNNNCGNPAEAVDNNKTKHIIRVADFYTMIHKLEDINIRFDIIEIFENTSNILFINHIKNAFDYSIMYKR